MRFLMMRKQDFWCLQVIAHFEITKIASSHCGFNSEIVDELINKIKSFRKMKSLLYYRYITVLVDFCIFFFAL